MNRITKYRAWDKKRKEMLEFDFADIENSADGSYLIYGNDIELYLDSNPVMQFTGLLDKNGVESYESDRIKITLNNRENWSTQDNIIEHLGTITYNNIKAQFVIQTEGKEFSFDYFQNIWKDDFSFEVIGNIWEEK